MRFTLPSFLDLTDPEGGRTPSTRPAPATFEEAAAPRTYAFNRYGVDVGSIAYDAAQDSYTVTPSDDGSGRPFSFANPDFNFKSLRVNAVFRWEFRPGSTTYIVWTQNREDEQHAGRLAFGPDAAALWNAPGGNIFMVTVSDWISR